MPEQQPLLARNAKIVSGRIVGHTILTKADPETTDEQEPPPRRELGGGTTAPLLTLLATAVDGSDLNGKSLVTRMGAESSDEGDDDR